MATRTLFHGTDADFTQFDLSRAVRDDHHANGALGVWFETRKEIAQRFGLHLITAEVTAERWYDMSIGELSRHARISCEVDYYQQLRLSLLDRGFQCINLVELDGQARQVIVMDLSAIRIATRTDHLVSNPA